MHISRRCNAAILQSSDRRTTVLDLTAPRRRSYVTLPGYRLGMDPPNKGRTFPAEVLSRAEVDRLLAACSRHQNAGLRMRALIAILYRSGLRISEALDLEVKDIDLDLGTVTVLHGKGDRRRTVGGVHGQWQALVELWIKRRRELGFARGIVFCVFSGPRAGERQHSSVVREALKDLAERAGIDKRVHPHGLRHTHAAEIAREGIPLHVIRRQLGHADLGTTARYIDHLTPQDVIDAIRARQD
jgi:site-specific recombinase XerD